MATEVLSGFSLNTNVFEGWVAGWVIRQVSLRHNIKTKTTQEISKTQETSL